MNQSVIGPQFPTVAIYPRQEGPELYARTASLNRFPSVDNMHCTGRSAKYPDEKTVS